MPRSSFPRALLSSLLIVAALAACVDTSPSAPAFRADSAAVALSRHALPGCNTSALAKLATALLPAPHRDPDLNLMQQVTSVVRLSTTDLARAQSIALQVGALLAHPQILAAMRDPNGTAPPTRGEATSSLVNALFTCVQLAPPGDIAGAYSPGGGAKVISGEVDDTLRSNDNLALLAVPAGAVTGAHLFTISPRTDKAIVRQCLPNMPGQYNQCYGYDVTPATTFAVPVTIAMCTIEEAGALYGTPSAEVHNRLHIASLDHHNPGRIRIHPRKEVPMVCDGMSVAQGPARGDGWLGGAWRVAAGVAGTLARPFRPRLAWAIDGVGTETDGFTDFTTVDNVAFSSGFEIGEVREGALPGAPPVPVVWTLDGYWNRNPMTGLTNSAVPSHVSLAPGDSSGGSLPLPFTGAVALWFGEVTGGNYGSPLDGAEDGGTSTAPRSGVAYSPYFSIPLLSNQVSLTFRSWFEIESINPSSFDLMQVQVEDSATAALTTVRTLNPADDPGSSSARLPFSSGGFNAPPVWTTVTTDLSAYAGSTVRLRFSFGTGDQLYNGFRGWVIDDVRVKALDALVTASFQASAAASRLSSTAARSSAASPAPARVWRP